MGTKASRRDKILEGLLHVVDDLRFMCIYTSNNIPLTPQNYAHAASELGCALGQRAKIVLNIHRDWLGYFEWSRIVLQGIWQGACVVSDPGLPDPTFLAGTHYIAEDSRHIGELIRWLLETEDGRAMLETVRRAGFDRARQLGCMRVTLAPVLAAFEQVYLTGFGSNARAYQ